MLRMRKVRLRKYKLVTQIHTFKKWLGWDMTHFFFNAKICNLSITCQLLHATSHGYFRFQGQYNDSMILNFLAVTDPFENLKKIMYLPSSQETACTYICEHEIEIYTDFRYNFRGVKDAPKASVDTFGFMDSS